MSYDGYNKLKIITNLLSSIIFILSFKLVNMEYNDDISMMFKENIFILLFMISSINISYTYMGFIF